MFLQFRVPSLTICFKQQQFALIVIILPRLLDLRRIWGPLNHNYSLHMQHVFTQEELNSFSIAYVYSALSFISHTKQSNECTWRRMSLLLRNLYKCKQVAWSIVVTFLFVYPLFLYCTSLLLVCFLIPFLILMLLLYFGLLMIM